MTAIANTFIAVALVGLVLALAACGGGEEVQVSAKDKCVMHAVSDNGAGWRQSLDAISKSC